MSANQFFVKDEGIRPEPYRYVESGLENVYLLNGFEEEDGDLTIKDIEGLHRAIALNIVMQRKAPSGRELRFLREEMDMTQAQLAHLLGINVQSVARWEKGQTEPNGAAVFALRILYLLSLVPEDDQGALLAGMKQRVEALNARDEVSDTVAFTYDDRRWKDAA